MAKKSKKKKVNVSRKGKNVLVGKVIKTSTKKGSNSLINTDGRVIASFGGICFFVTKETALFIKNIKQEITGKWVNHEILGKKAKPEFVGPELRSLTFEIIVDVQFGYKPHSILKKIHQLVEKGKVDTFFVGTHKIGAKWRMTKASDEFTVIYAGGKLARASINVTLEEY